VNYDRATVEHAARALHQHETGRTLPPNSASTDAQRAELAPYLTRAEKALPFVREFKVDALIAADHTRRSQEAA
jgi:hypothetical protein